MGDSDCADVPLKEHPPCGPGFAHSSGICESPSRQCAASDLEKCEALWFSAPSHQPRRRLRVTDESLPSHFRRRNGPGFSAGRFRRPSGSPLSTCPGHAVSGLLSFGHAPFGAAPSVSSRPATAPARRSLLQRPSLRPAAYRGGGRRMISVLACQSR